MRVNIGRCRCRKEAQDKGKPHTHDSCGRYDIIDLRFTGVRIIRRISLPSRSSAPAASVARVQDVDGMLPYFLLPREPEHLESPRLFVRYACLELV